MLSKIWNEPFKFRTRQSCSERLQALDELRAVRQDQQEFASLETRKRLREELGADFILQGLKSTRLLIWKVKGAYILSG